MKLKLRGVRPDVRALAPDHERDVPHELDPEVAHLPVRRVPLLVQRPLDVGVLQKIEREIGARPRDRRRRPIAVVVAPRRPAPAPVQRTERLEQRQVIEPPALAAYEVGQALRARRAREPFALVESLERDVERARLERPDPRVVHARRGTELLERGPHVAAQDLAQRVGIEVLDRLDVGVDRIEAERGQRTVRARLAGRERVWRKHLQQPLPRAAKPVGTGRQIGQLANSPVSARPDREERQNDASLSTHRSISTRALRPGGCQNGLVRRTRAPSPPSVPPLLFFIVASLGLHTAAAIALRAPHRAKSRLRPLSIRRRPRSPATRSTSSRPLPRPPTRTRRLPRRARHPLQQLRHGPLPRRRPNEAHPPRQLRAAPPPSRHVPPPSSAPSASASRPTWRRPSRARSRKPRAPTLCGRRPPSAPQARRR